jgi:hypothetical protein
VSAIGMEIIASSKLKLISKIPIYLIGSVLGILFLNLSIISIYIIKTVGVL